MSLLQSDRYRARAPDAVTLLGIARDALAIKLPLYVSSVMGLPWTWLPPFERYSEYRIIDLWRMRRTLSLSSQHLPAGDPAHTAHIGLADPP